jgi:polyisoprenoid-binding protein YceI
MSAPSETTTTPDVSGDYTIDAVHSRIGFVARHAMVTKVRGSFNDFAGSLHIDLANPASSTANVAIEVASVDTRNEQRDGHLRTNDFFDAPNHPQITFTTTSVQKVDDENFKVTGDLTIKGTTKSVVIDWEFGGVAIDPYGNVRAGFDGKTSINRSDFGVTFNAGLETGGVLVSEKINLEFEISAIKNA